MRKTENLWISLSIWDFQTRIKKKYEFWYDYVKPKYGEKVKLCFIVDIKTDYIHKKIAQDL